jgi:glucosamine--fructose-6-phosphate aminotransferase (isomerizing)
VITVVEETTWYSFEEALERQAEALDRSIGATRDWIEANHGRFDGKSLLFVGIGASHAALATPVHVLREHGVRAFRSACSDLPDGTPPLADLYIGVSQSGRSRETVQALIQVPREDRVAVVNFAPSPLAEQADHVLSLGGVTDSMLSSIAFSATLAGLGMLAERVGSGAIAEGWDGIGSRMDEFSARVAPVLREFAEAVVSRSSVDVVAAAANLSAAEQGSLLLREGPWIPSTFMDTRSYLHGPMDTAGPGTAHIVLGGEREGLLVDQLREKDVPTLFIATDGATAGGHVIDLPDLSPAQQALAQVLLLQRLTVVIAEVKGKNLQDRAFTRLDTKVDSLQQVIDGTY